MSAKNVRTTDGYTLVNFAATGPAAVGVADTALDVPDNTPVILFDNAAPATIAAEIRLPLAKDYLGAPPILATLDGTGGALTFVARTGSNDTVGGDVGPISAAGATFVIIATDASTWEVIQTSL